MKYKKKYNSNTYFLINENNVVVFEVVLTQMRIMANSIFFPFQSLYKKLQIFYWYGMHDQFSPKQLNAHPNNDYTTKKKYI